MFDAPCLELLSWIEQCSQPLHSHCVKEEIICMLTVSEITMSCFMQNANLLEIMLKQCNMIHISSNPQLKYYDTSVIEDGGEFSS